jgi:hypothetical protein
MSRSPRFQRTGLTALEVVVVLLILLVATGILLPALQKVRRIASQIQCANNLKEITLGMHTCHDVHKRFPPGIGFFPNPSGGAYGTGLFHLLPFIDQDGLYKKAKASDGTWTPYNNGVYATLVQTFVCPTDPSAGDGLVQDRQGTTWGASSYAGNVQVFAKVDQVGSLVDWQGQTTRQDITDGTSNTILFAEHYAVCTNPSWADGGSFWAYQNLGSTAMPLHSGFAINWTVFSYGPGSRFQTQPTPFQGNCDPTLASSPHAVMMVGMCDGHVRSVSPSVSGHSWWSACTPRGGEGLGADWNN